MSKIAFSWMLLGLTPALLFSCDQAGTNTIRIGQGANSSTEPMRHGQVLELSLAGNPSTGYVWEPLRGAQFLLQLQGSPQFAPSSSAIGAGGMITFRFRAESQGKPSSLSSVTDPGKLASLPPKRLRLRSA